jgi:polynucleotide 5'-kinase involved in rRNA processing
MAQLSETLLRVFTVRKYRAAWHKLGILEFTLETVASRIFQSFQRNEIDFDTLTHACESIEKLESLHAEELGLA